MTSQSLMQQQEIVHLSGISWHTYESLLNELSTTSRFRLTYYRGNLEIMAPSPEHETSSSKDRFAVYAEMGVPEIWRYDGNVFTINILEDGKYIVVDESLAFPNLPLTEISNFLKNSGSKKYLELVREFRDWVRSQIQ
ncbi:hypothetical protein H6G54_25090 [Anabaena cylindrica FACHB-243]|uniref:Uncharacterized protein n=1 Tax=Anabaena cylindrica (strain ATCC 27899 / PCC 7122) TaxID=272123 RepID=K9ZFA4_ANACC|nr:MULTISPECIES: hypothetical protein [Anabaena]AFZ57247.1 hypothetical protein Anacy_R0021 [Anabaena cylindrica PCC 7122]MBD2420916.1 hypothetical protein [Anabaena cylindrica FACHB-243]MBY5285462.1 hypothetical protein [Anabaena sp. CCAP 1446/1C]MBY5308687.1 hypothetical protein [Anabaena sp. CCAP 1446/1C]MCM2405669.1 Uma2 family endonuclease [Anabaena sp. CCAP 1446/1C]